MRRVSNIRDLVGESDPDLDTQRTASEEAVGGLLPGDDPQGHPMHREANQWAHRPHSELRAAYEASTDAEEARAIMHAMQLQQLQHRGGC